MTKETSFGGVVVGCLTLILLTPFIAVAAILIEGYVVQQLWGYFITPFGLPAISYLHAAGVATLFRFMCPSLDTSDLVKKENTSPVVTLIARVVGLLLLKPAIVLFVGYLIHSYMV